MIRTYIVLAIFAVLLFLAGFGAGRFIGNQQLAIAAEAPPPAGAPVTLSDATTMPSRDVTGGDIHGLPRYPGAVRVEYRYGIVEDLAETEVEYVVMADLDAVRDFYRQAFDEEGWIVADLGIYQGEWTFFVVSGEREAIVELEVRQSLVEIEIELSEPLAE